jgi:hypothetical protein
MDPLPNNCMVLSKTDNPHLAEMVKTLQPGDEIDITLGAGDGTIKLKFTVDENLEDRISGQIRDPDEKHAAPLNLSGDQEPNDTNPQSMPGDGLGASVMAAMGRPK